MVGGDSKGKHYCDKIMVWARVTFRLHDFDPKNKKTSFNIVLSKSKWLENENEPVEALKPKYKIE